MKLKDEAADIVVAIQNVTEKEGDPWGYFKNVTAMINEMARCIDKQPYDQKKRKSMCGAVGRALMDNYSFTESPLGQRIFNFLQRFQNLED